jgi:hypothetical protein
VSRCYLFVYLVMSSFLTQFDFDLIITVQIDHYGKVKHHFDLSEISSFHHRLALEYLNSSQATSTGRSKEMALSEINSPPSTFDSSDICPNGIAFNAKDNVFYVTGKLWSKSYLTLLLANESSDASSTSTGSETAHSRSGNHDHDERVSVHEFSIEASPLLMLVACLSVILPSLVCICFFACCDTSRSLCCLDSSHHPYESVP